MKEEVIFVLDDKQYPYKYDRSRLHLGTLVNVSINNDGEAVKFAETKSVESVPYAVTWISPDQWHVRLENKYRAIPHQITAVYTAVDSYADKIIVDQALEEIQKDFRLEHLYKTKEYENSRLSVVITVAERLDLITRLQKKEVAKSAFHQHESLCVYLLLTCFDRLGQPAAWLDFGPWLESKEKLVEREKTLQNLGKSGTPVEIANHLFKEYKKIYGTRSAFSRFLREILPQDMRQELLESIDYSSIPNPPRKGVIKELRDKEKEDYLFRLRNNYTHSATFILGVGKNWFDSPTPISWSSYEQWREEKNWFSVSVRNWPDVIEKAVRVGLVEYLKNVITKP